MNKTAAVALLLLAGALASCESQPQMMGRMVDPIVTEVGNDGKTAKVNMGAYDGVHGGQKLYVARNNQLVGILAVRKMETYASECLVVASRDVSQGQATQVLARVQAGDKVYQSMSGFTRPGMPSEQVPRMVPVPYEEQEKPVDTTQNPPDPNKPTVKDVRVPVIPRDQVDEWMKTHPRKAQ